VGRSLGIHLVLASQRLEESRLRELEAHLSWRLALRTFTETESRAVLGVAAAAALPREPGWALLRTGPEPPCRLRISPAGAAFRATTLAEIEAATGSGERASPIWRPSPTTSPAALALESSVAPGMVPVGLADDPVRPSVLGIDPRTGHLAVVGRPGSGKSTLLGCLAQGAERRGLAVRRLARSDEVPVLGDRAGWDAWCGGAEVVILIVDDWSILRQERPGVEEALVRAALAEPRLRLYLAAHRWADVRAGLRDLLTTRIELRLADPFDSVFDRHRAAAVPVGRPGWGLLEGEPFLAALPTPGTSQRGQP